MLLRATTPDRTLIRPDADTMRAGEPIVHSSPMSEVERREAHTYLAGVAQRLNARDVAVEYEVAQGSPSAVIIEIAHRLPQI